MPVAARKVETTIVEHACITLATVRNFMNELEHKPKPLLNG